jgi:hypothetical protein
MDESGQAAAYSLIAKSMAIEQNLKNNAPESSRNAIYIESTTFANDS